jgi:hypothetical protein
MSTSTTTMTTRRPPTSVAQHEAAPIGLVTTQTTTPHSVHGNAGLTIDLIDGDHVTLMALDGVHESGAVAHRLTTLITAGVRHISIDLRRVREVAPPTLGCLTDIAFHLSDTGGTLELLNAQPVVAAAFAASSKGHNSRWCSRD